MSCFTGDIIDNEILFDCYITKATGKNHDLDKLPRYRALLDTGAQSTCITKKAADKLGLAQGEWDYINGIGGIMPCAKSIIDLTIPSGKMVRIENTNGKIIEKRLSTPEDLFCSVNVWVLESASFDFDVLLGMDIITQCHFQIHTNGTFTLCI